MRLKKVVLPAPLGPITADKEPLGKFIETSEVAVTPPKDLLKCSMRSIS
jgi:hypothetical protein